MVLGASLRDFDLGREIAPNVVVGGLVGGTAVEQGTVRGAVTVHRRAVLPVVAVGDSVGGSVGRAVGRHAAIAGGAVAVGKGKGGCGRGSFPPITGRLGAGLEGKERAEKISTRTKQRGSEKN